MFYSLYRLNVVFSQVPKPHKVRDKEQIFSLHASDLPKAQSENVKLLRKRLCIEQDIVTMIRAVLTSVRKEDGKGASILPFFCPLAQ